MTDKAIQNWLRFVQWIVARQLFSFFKLYIVRNWVYRKCFNIGKNSIILERTSMQQLHYLKGKLTIGANVTIQREVLLDYSGGLTIGDGAVISQGGYILTHTHEIGGADKRSGVARPMPVTIGKGAWLGAKSVILGGVTIGDGAVIGAGSVITKSVPPNEVWAGNPAKLIRSLTDNAISI